MSTAQMAPPVGTVHSSYQRLAGRRLLLLAVLAVLVLVLTLVDLASGPSNLSVAQLVHGLISPASLSPEDQVIVWQVRLPYALMAVLVGAALGLAGAEMQTVLNNPLASPYTLGLSAAGSVGAALVVIAGWNWTLWGENLALPAGAFVCATLATLLILGLSWRLGASTETVVLFGIGLMFSLEALLWLLQFLADSQSLQQIVFWSMGSLSRATPGKLMVLSSVLALCVLGSARQVWAMTLLRAGEDQARSMGIAVSRLRLLTLLRISLLSATVLAFVGTIGFVGLVGPHISRLLVGEDHRYYLPGSMLAGAVMLCGASILSKTLIAGVILPVGIITALIGVPLFMVLIARRRTAP